MVPSQTDPTERNLRILYEISCAMRTTLELKHVLYIILTGVTSHFGLEYNRAILFLFNPKNQTLKCEMAIGPESGEEANKIWKYIDQSEQRMEDLIHEERLEQTYHESNLYLSLKDMTFSVKDMPDCLLCQAYHRGHAWHLPPEEVEKFKDDPFLKKFQSHELLIMPLKAQDQINGLIVADNIFTKKPISDADIRFFRMLANQAGLAIENSRLYEMVVAQSQTDSLTGLWNHGYFQKNLVNEIEASKRSGEPFTLAMIDIDDFKKLNDTCGHQHGDQILKDISRLLTESLRPGDYVCRYGGEEFAMILKNSNGQNSFEIAEHLRTKIAEHNFPSPSGVGYMRFTVCIGLASYPTDVSSKDALIRLADQAMYQAKSSGKNKTCSAASIDPQKPFH
ncbi:MAG TPA: sensor domain-containing diguanylate cyclase [Candidatus Omnitrophota bacterium]|nr:sensor domain-containing diguanylate cyclase [Candidatus Omnitrophota bacterium]